MAQKREKEETKLKVPTPISTPPKLDPTSTSASSFVTDQAIRSAPGSDRSDPDAEIAPPPPTPTQRQQQTAAAAEATERREETRAKIRVYGTKARKGEKVEITSSDGNEAKGTFEELYVQVSADTYDKVDAAVTLIEMLVTPVSVCPVCAMRVGVDMVAHITLQHGNIFKMQRQRKSRKGGSLSTLSLLRRELRDGNLQSLFGGSSCITSTNAAPDPLLSSFILPMADDFESIKPHSASEMLSVKKRKNENVSERDM